MDLMQKKVHLKTKHLVQLLKISQDRLFVVVLLIILLDNIFLFLPNQLTLLLPLLFLLFFVYLGLEPQVEKQHFVKLFGVVRVQNVGKPCPSYAALCLLILFQMLLINHFPQKIPDHELVQLILTCISAKLIFLNH